MIEKNQYIKANVPHTIYNNIGKSFFHGGNIYNLIYESTHNSNHNNIVSCDEYYNACIEYFNNILYDDKAMSKFIKELKFTFVSPNFKQEMKDFDCNSEKEFIKMIRKLEGVTI